jgi:hypothetical protein
MFYQTTTTVKIDGEVYDVGYPNVGQQLEIENLKNVFTKGRYAQIASTNSKTGIQLLDLVDAISYFSVLIPKLKKTFAAKKFDEIDVAYQRKLSKAFIKYYNEFVLKVEAEINKDLDEPDEEETEKGDDEQVHEPFIKGSMSGL